MLAAGARGPLKVAAPELGPALGGSRRAPGAREGREPRPKGPRGNPLVAFSFYHTPLRLPRVKRCRCGGCEWLCARGVPPVFVTALPPLPPPSLSSSPWKSLYRVLKVLLFFFSFPLPVFCASLPPPALANYLFVIVSLVSKFFGLLVPFSFRKLCRALPRVSEPPFSCLMKQTNLFLK